MDLGSHCHFCYFPLKLPAVWIEEPKAQYHESCYNALQFEKQRQKDAADERLKQSGK